MEPDGSKIKQWGRKMEPSSKMEPDCSNMGGKIDPEGSKMKLEVS